MGAMRKAGVWLGLIEDEDDRYEERYHRDRGYRGYNADPDEFADEDDDDVDDLPVAPRARTAADRLTDRGTDRSADRGGDRGAERDSGRLGRAGLRSIARPSSTSTASLGELAGRSGQHFATRDNLALAPQISLRERAVVAEDEERRYQITTLHPTTYNEARTIGEHFREGVPVIMNLTEMDEADAKRLVDFAAGLVFGLRGNFERVTNRVFLLSPANVQVTEADKAKIAEGGFFNQS